MIRARTQYFVDSNTHSLGLASSRLPEFTAEEKVEIAGSADFFGLNGYTSRLVTSKEKPIRPASWESDRDTSEVDVKSAMICDGCSVEILLRS